MTNNLYQIIMRISSELGESPFRVVQNPDRLETFDFKNPWNAGHGHLLGLLFELHKTEGVSLGQIKWTTFNPSLAEGPQSGSLADDIATDQVLRSALNEGKGLLETVAAISRLEKTYRVARRLYIESFSTLYADQSATFAQHGRVFSEDFSPEYKRLVEGRCALIRGAYVVASM